MSKSLTFSKAYRISWAIREITINGYLEREEYEDMMFVGRRTSTRDFAELKTIFEMIYEFDFYYSRTKNRYEVKEL